MTIVYSLCALVVDQPGGAQAMHTGEYDKNGNPVMRKISRQIPPHQFFRWTQDASELEKMIELEAVRHLTDSERLAVDHANAEVL